VIAFRRSKEVIKTVDISIDRFHFAHRRSYIALSNFDTAAGLHRLAR
jgi:hypothetical protein